MIDLDRQRVAVASSAATPAAASPSPARQARPAVDRSKEPIASAARTRSGSQGASASPRNQRRNAPQAAKGRSPLLMWGGIGFLVVMVVIVLLLRG